MDFSKELKMICTVEVRLSISMELRPSSRRLPRFAGHRQLKGRKRVSAIVEIFANYPSCEGYRNSMRI